MPSLPLHTHSHLGAHPEVKGIGEMYSDTQMALSIFVFLSRACVAKAQGRFLALCSGVTSGGAQEPGMVTHLNQGSA